MSERARHLMMAALDGELSASEQAELDRLLDADPGLRDEWDKLRKVKEVTDTMGYRKPPEEVWDNFWGSVYNRTERGLGWILFSAGALVLLSWVTWNVVEELAADADLPMAIKLAIAGVVVGSIVLLVSVIREKLFTRKTDPYKEVQR